MERIIGEIFELDGEWYQCMKGNTCNDCAFYRSSCGSLTGKGSCRHDFREDATNVIFKKLEKVGEPFTISGTLYQHYKVFDIDNVCGEGFWCIHNYKAKTLTIEIRQNQEDMKEKEPTYEELLHYYHSTVGLWAIDRSPQEVSLAWICDNAFQLGIDKKDSNSEKVGKNLKPFDIQKAREGKPVCTRDGRKARIICFDTKGDPCPIIALVEENGLESTYHYDKNGQNAYNKSKLDLMMLPEKKEGWVNVYKVNMYNTEK